MLRESGTKPLAKKQAAVNLRPVHPKTVIGWSEYLDFPEWGIRGLKAKVDTGARTSALHVEDLEVIGHDRVRFDVIISSRKPFRYRTVECRIVKWGRVRSSTGEYSERCFVSTLVRIGPVEKEIEVSLVSREKMLFRMLLGRKALEHDFLVDVGRRSLLTQRPPRRKKKIVAPSLLPKPKKNGKRKARSSS